MEQLTVQDMADAATALRLVREWAAADAECMEATKAKDRDRWHPADARRETAFQGLRALGERLLAGKVSDGTDAATG